MKLYPPCWSYSYRCYQSIYQQTSSLACLLSKKEDFFSRHISTIVIVNLLILGIFTFILMTFSCYLYLANLFSLLVFFSKSFFIRVLLYNPGLISNNHFHIIVLSCLKSMQKLIRRKSMSIMALHVWLTKMLKTAIFVTDGVNNDLNYSGKSH